MKRILNLFAAASLLSASALAQNPSPTPNPTAGTYLDPTLSMQARVGLAASVISSGTASPALTGAIDDWLLATHPYTWTVQTFPTLAAGVIADPTIGGGFTAPGDIARVLYDAISYTAATDGTLSNAIAVINPLLTSTNLIAPWNYRVMNVYEGLIIKEAQPQITTGDYSDALNELLPVAGSEGDNDQAIPLVLQCKIATRAADVLSWAKLMYEFAPFPQTQTGINGVSSAFRTLDMNLIRANQFIGYETSGTGTNPLATVTLPSVTFQPTDAGSQALIAGITQGNPVTALQIAGTQFATAPAGPQLNTAVALMAQWLRNIDGNLVRANAFVQAQTSGSAYNIPELSGTGE